MSMRATAAGRNGSKLEDGLRFLASRRLALILFAILILLMIPTTLTSGRSLYLLWPLRAVLTGLGVNLLVCTVHRLRQLTAAVLLLHGGTLVVMAGCLLSGFGFVATVNVHEGSSVSRAFRWDLEQDMDLGLALTVKKIHAEYYPVAVRIGVLKNDEKHRLVESETGDGFALDGMRIGVDELDPQARVLRLSVHDAAGRALGSLTTSGSEQLSVPFPYSFRLVAFKDPVIRRVWVDLALVRDGKVLAEGVSEVNAPFVFEGRRYFNTQVARDPQGFPYAGIQIVRDPGIPAVYAGFLLLAAGGALFYRGKRGKSRSYDKS